MLLEGVSAVHGGYNQDAYTAVATRTQTRNAGLPEWHIHPPTAQAREKKYLYVNKEFWSQILSSN